MRRAATPLLAVATALAACSPSPRPTAYFDAHPSEIDAVLAACAGGAHRGGECDTAGSAKAHRAANARMSVYRRTFEADRVGAAAGGAPPLRDAVRLRDPTGSISEPIMDFAVRSLKLAFIYMLATTVAYSDWVTQPLFHTLPDTLTQAISGNSTPNVGAAFDGFLARAGYLSEKVAKTATPIDLSPIIDAALVYVIGALAAAIGFGVVLVAKVALALIVALGPVFIACALFDATRRFFFGWLSQAVNYIVLMALIITIFQMILSLVGSQWGQIDGADPTVGAGLFIALSILGVIFFLQTPSIASGIAGGASAGIADFGAIVGMASSAAMSMGSGGATSAASGASKAASPGGSLRPASSRS